MRVGAASSISADSRGRAHHGPSPSSRWRWRARVCLPCSSASRTRDMFWRSSRAAAASARAGRSEPVSADPSIRRCSRPDVRSDPSGHDRRGVVVECIEIGEDRVFGHAPGSIRATRRPGVHGADLPRDGFGAVLQIDRVAERFAHLRVAVGAHETWDASDKRLWLREDRLELAVEAPRRFARQLDVRQLVFADRHEMGAGSRMFATCITG